MTDRILVQTLLFSGILSLAFATPTWANSDVFAQKNPDPAIKMIHFPQSMTVVESINKEKNKTWKSVANDPKPVKRTLRKVDPARIVPVKMGKPVEGRVNRSTLESLGIQYKTDILLLFRRTLTGDTPAQMIAEGLVYFAKQKKIVPLPANSNDVSQSGDVALQNANHASLKQLAAAAKKVIHSYKFEVRRSGY